MTANQTASTKAMRNIAPVIVSYIGHTIFIECMLFSSFLNEEKCMHFETEKKELNHDLKKFTLFIAFYYSFSSQFNVNLKFLWW